MSGNLFGKFLQNALQDLNGNDELRELTRIFDVAAPIIRAAETIVQNVHHNKPVEQQVLQGLAAGTQAIHVFVPPNEVTPRITSLLDTASNIATTATNNNIPLENRIIAGIAQGLQGIGAVTPLEDFVTVEVGKLLARISEIVKYAVDNKNSDGRKVIQCSGEAVLGIAECVVNIIKGVDALNARNAGPRAAPAITDNRQPQTPNQLAILFSSKNYTQEALQQMPEPVQDYIHSAANQSVVVAMDAIYKLYGVISANVDSNLIALKMPKHVFAEIYVELARNNSDEPNHAQTLIAKLTSVYQANETQIANIAGLALIVGSLHMAYNIDYTLPTIIACGLVAKIESILDPQHQALAVGVFAAVMICKDNVLPGGLIMLAAWAALVPALVEKPVLAAMIESKYQPETKHQSLRM